MLFIMSLAVDFLPFSSTINPPFNSLLFKISAYYNFL